MESILPFGPLALMLSVLLSQMFKILKEYERGVIFFLGRFQTVEGPGLIVLIPESPPESSDVAGDADIGDNERRR